MRNLRLIARLDVKTDNLVKGIRLEGLRKLGQPNEYAKRYYSSGVDEVLYVDIVASLYERNSLTPIIERASENIFIPMTVTGGIRTLDDARKLLTSGADKLGVNTGAVKRPELVSEISDNFGSQCMVASIEAKSLDNGGWEVYYDNGREKTGIDVLDWVREVEARGAGEVLLTSVDQEGTAQGMDLDLLSKVSDSVNIPVIASGGIGSLEDIDDVVRHTSVSAIALARVLHYEELSIPQIKSHLRLINGLEIR